MKKRYFLLIAVLLSTITTCKAKPPTMVGGDKDAHGCIPSAGYQWCGKENKCVRSWELEKEKEKGLENTESDFKRHCAIK